MNTTRTGSLAAALALTAATTVAVLPAHAAAAAVEAATVQFATEGTASSVTGSMENGIVQAGLVIIAGLGVSVALAISAGVAGGAIELPQIPGFPL